MKAMQAEASSAEDRVAEVPPSRIRAWRGTAAQRQTTGGTGATRAGSDEGDAPSGWWLVPAILGGVMFWIWLIRLVIGWVAALL